MFRTRLWILAASAALLLCVDICSSAAGSEALPDPTRPVVLSGERVPSADKPKLWQLTSTLISPQRRVAVINGQVVQVGQAINGAKLLAVEPGSALLSRAGHKIKLKLIANPVKRVVDAAP